MILNVYCYYNKLLEAFGNFQLDDHEPDKVIAGLARDVRAQFLQGADLSKIRYLDVYVLGTFNDETGEFINDKKLLLDLGQIITQLEAAKVAAEKAKENKDGNNTSEEVQ